MHHSKLLIGDAEGGGVASAPMSVYAFTEVVRHGHREITPPPMLRR